MWEDKDAHELTLLGTNITVNVGAILADRQSTEYRGVRADLNKLITPTEEEGTWKAMRPHSTDGISSPPGF